MTMPVLLFAAGFGTRMGALTKTIPKPLVRVDDRPLIDHALGLLQGQGLAPVVVNLHYLGAMIRAHLAGREVLFSDEAEQILETGGGLRKALPLLGPGPVLTLNTDAVWRGPNPVAQVLAGWGGPPMQALLLLVPQGRATGHAGPGDFSADAQGRLTRRGDLVYTGLQVIDPAALAGIPERVFSMNRVWDDCAARGTLFGRVMTGRWCDVGRPESIGLAERMLKDADDL